MIRQALIDAIQRDTRTNYRIAKDAGVGKSTVYRLLGGDDITMVAADKIARTLGMTFRPVTPVERIVMEERRMKVSREIGRNR